MSKPKISPARIAAFEILKRVEKDRAYTSVLLPEYEEALGDKDKALCHTLVLGVLRTQIYLDRLIGFYSNARKLDLEVQISLRLALFQLRFLDRIPQHSAVNESVDLVARARKSSAKGFVNALLRRLIRGPHELSYTGELDRISVETSHPVWLLKRWMEAFGPEIAERIATANNQMPSIAFRRTLRSLPDVEYENTRPSRIASSGFVADSVTKDLADAAADGRIYFQDEGSQMVGEMIEMAPGMSFLDVCAAPGSKFSQIALGYSRPSERNLLVAGDLHSKRVKFLKESCTRQGIDCFNVVQYDALYGLPFADGSFDRVLVDAPCSGTGTIRHNPEIRYFLEPDDLTDLNSKQLRILMNASKMVRKGGKLIYSTCSLEHEENEAVANAFLSNEDVFKLSHITEHADLLTADGYMRTRPDRDDIDGFFVAVFDRV